MAVAYGTIVAGQTVSSAFELRSTERALVIGINSAASNVYYAAFQPAAGAGFVRTYDFWNTISGAVFAGANGGWGLVPNPPATTFRLEATGAMGATTSFALVEVARP